MTVALSAHRDLEAMLAQDPLIVVRTVLRYTFRVVNAAFGRRTECDGRIQRTDRRSRFILLLTAQPMTPRECRSRITARYNQPSRVQTWLTSPAHFWFGASALEVTIQQVRRDIKFMIAIRRDLVFARSHDRYAALTHQTAYAAMPNVQANFLQLLRHPWPAVAAQTKTRLFFDRRQRDQIRSLSAAGSAIAECPQTARADIHNTAHPPDGKYGLVPFPSQRIFNSPAGQWMNPNLMALAREEHRGLFQDFPCLLENAVPAAQPIILPDEAQSLFRTPRQFPGPL